MYEEPTQIAPGKLGAPVGLAKDVSPLQATLNRQGEQIEKLGGLVSQLSERLSPVRNSMPTSDQSAQNTTEPAASMIVGQVMRQTDMIQILQARVQELLNDLEV
ncbi:MAG TPA: hypothetical protein VFT87_05495 [Candidatus Saccharimonadales bacterium]|nr:hypothetical protein [Candidatus Saccharimonadales bacterium]